MSILTPWPIKPYPKNPPPPLARAFDWDDAEDDKHEQEPELDDDGEPGVCPTCNAHGAEVARVTRPRAGARAVTCWSLPSVSTPPGSGPRYTVPSGSTRHRAPRAAASAATCAPAAPA